MAKTDNLTDFLTGVAGAIRTKKGTTALINPQDFESEIGSIDTAKPEQTKTLTVTENGTQTVKPDTGKVLSGVTVTTNVPATPTKEKTVDLAMASGNQVVTPASGKHLTKVTITKPATLAAGNIKSGVNIGGVTGTLSPAKTEQAKTVDLAMASGNQVVSPDSGKVLSGVTITKPTTLVASNIKKGVTIGGVAGSYNPTFTTETKTVDLAMGSGNQVISKSSGKDGMTQVTITKPSTMLPANIKKGVNIGGVVGSLEAPSLQNSKAVTITSNGTTTITPDASYDAMKNVSVTVNVAGSSGGRYNTPATLEITLPDTTPAMIMYIDNKSKELIKGTVTQGSSIDTYVGETVVIYSSKPTWTATGNGVTFPNDAWQITRTDSEVCVFVVTAANASINIVGHESSGGGSAP